MATTSPSAPAAAQAGSVTHAAFSRMVQGVLADARFQMERVAEATRMALQARQDQARTPGELNAVREARESLLRLASVMAERYPDALRKALEQSAPAPEKSSRSLFTVHFDELELMDEAQVNESVERARAQQVLVSAAEGPLADLDALVCAVLGLPRVQAGRNPLRPEAFLQALQAVVSQMQVSDAVRHEWMGAMAPALGHELRTLYLAQIDALRQAGVQPVGYAMRQGDGQVVYVAPATGGVAPGFAMESDQSEAAASADPLLTLESLRRLLLGELTGPAALAAAPAQDETAAALPPIETPAEAPPPADFAATVPAAFEALQEMNQVQDLVARLGERRQNADIDNPSVMPSSAAPGTAPDAAAPRPAHGLGEALSMEVVSLMVDNIARDQRLLWPVQQFIRALEPALMQLALADPRFFSHKEHAARRLLQDITERSLGFSDAQAPEFQSFMRSLMRIAGPLAAATIDGEHDFAQVLEALQARWAEKDQARKEERQRAIAALQHAERRHLLAAQISREIWLHPQIGDVPEAVSRFLQGAWAQVMAQARLSDTSGSTDPGRYRELVDALVWSVQPELTRTHTGRLARLLPKLLTKLREGLASIDYPADRTEAVFELLMQLHQQAFQRGPRAASRPAAPPAPQPTPAPTAASAMQATAPSGPSLLDDDDPWVAPSEARESGYMELSQAPESVPPAPATEPVPVPPTAKLPPLQIGMWAHLQVAGDWERAQLSWIGSQGNLFLFTSASGRTQSMTLRLLERMFQQGTLQLLTEPSVVDGALDAVAQAAMRNSVESRL